MVDKTRGETSLVGENIIGTGTRHREDGRNQWQARVNMQSVRDVGKDITDGRRGKTR